jgi:hypothetical protein
MFLPPGVEAAMGGVTKSPLMQTRINPSPMAQVLRGGNDASQVAHSVTSPTKMGIVEQGVQHGKNILEKGKKKGQELVGKGMDYLQSGDFYNQMKGVGGKIATGALGAVGAAALGGIGKRLGFFGGMPKKAGWSQYIPHAGAALGGGLLGASLAGGGRRKEE